MSKNKTLCGFLIFFIALVSCKQQPSVTFFNVTFGSDVEEALTLYNKTGERYDVVYIDDDDFMSITLFQQQFYNVKFDYIDLKYNHDKLTSIKLRKDENRYSGNPCETINSAYKTLVQRLEQDYGEAFQSNDSQWEIEFHGNGVIILVSHSENSEFEEAELNVEIRPN